MYYHLRFTPYELSSENLTNFCDKYQRFIIAHERYKKDGITETAPHFHVWLDSDRNLDSVRTAFKKALGIPIGGQGRNNKYYSLEQYRKEEDVSYIIKQKDIRACKGFDREELIARVPPEPKKEEKMQASAAAPPAASKEKDCFWKKILEEAMFQKFQKKKEIDLEEALNIISRVYIKRMLPLPHPGDRKRWATSLVMYAKMDFMVEEREEKIEELIQENTVEFMAEHFVSNKQV